MAYVVSPEKKRQVRAGVYLSKAEYEEVKQTANRHNLTVSTYLYNLLLSKPLPAPDREELIDALLKLNADLARLGNLFKLAIDEENLWPEKLEGIIEEIRSTQKTIKEKVKKI